MINRTILENKLLNKFRNLTLHSIVNECFIGALPFTKNELTKEDILSLSRYSLTVLEAVGGYDGAVERINNIKNIKHKAFLSDIINICDTAAFETTKRVATETDYKNSDYVDPVVNNSVFNTEEYDKFKSAVGSIDTDTISKIITDKTIEAIKNEKELQEQDATMKEELATALSESKDFKDVTMESYLDIVLDVKATRSPVTFFSKVLEAAYENLLYTKEDFKEIPFETLSRITFENTLPLFRQNRNPIECFESLISINCNTNPAPETERSKVMDTAMICSIVIYTILEVLKTLHIYSPGPYEIEKFIKNTPSYSEMIFKDKSNLLECCNANIESIRKYCMVNSKPQDLSNARAQLMAIKDKIVEVPDNTPAFLNAKSEVLSSIESLINEVSGKLNVAKEAAGIKRELTSSEKYAIESDIAGMNKINTIFGKNTNVSDICIMFDPAEESLEYLDVLGKDVQGHTVTESFIEVRFSPRDNEEYIKEFFTKSKLHDCNKNVYLCYSDGSGKKFKLN